MPSTVTRPGRRRRLLLHLGLVLLVSAGNLFAVSSSARADDGLPCSRSWHYIMHAESHRYVVESMGGQYAWGTRNVEPWNQQLVFCRQPGWGPDHYAIKTNVSKCYWNRDVETELYHPLGIHCPFEDWNQLFEVKRLPNSKFWTILSITPGWTETAYLYADPSRGYGLYGDPRGVDDVNGGDLFEITSGDLMS